jgi:serine/threonine protein kinase
VTADGGQAMAAALVQSTAPGPRPGQRLGKYELIRRLAQGGMAEIYLARVQGIEGFEKVVVVKRILPSFAENKEFVRLFLDEARLAATLHHPNIAQVYDVGISGGQYFFAMEHVHGHDLRYILSTLSSAGQALSLENALTILQGVCAGLHYAHERRGMDGNPLGLIHRDVSPSNVLVSYDGCPKLVDFGIAKAATSTVETRAGSVRGKISYLSPEQCRCEPLDRRSDVFAVGIVLYEATVMRRLFAGTSDFEVMQRIVGNDVPLPSKLVPDYPPELERVLLKALAPLPADRYQTVQELQLDLETFAREKKVAVSPIGLQRFMEQTYAADIEAWRTAQGQGKDIAEHLATVTSAPSLPTMPSGHAAAAAREEKIAPTTASSPLARKRQSLAAVEPRRGSRRLPFVVAAVALVVAALAVAFGLSRASRTPAPTPEAQVQLQVITEPAGAVLSIDGARQVFVTPSTYQTKRADRLTLRFELEGYETHEQLVPIAANESAKVVRAQLQKVGGAAATQPTAATQPQPAVQPPAPVAKPALKPPAVKKAGATKAPPGPAEPPPAAKQKKGTLFDKL